MKLLLTSGGIRNESMRKALRELVGSEEIRIAFIPTAGNIDSSDKEWLITDFVDSRKLGPVDIVDISAVPRTNWQPRLEAANVIIIGGGNTFYLMRWVRKSGLEELLPDLLKTRVYVGISAGSIITNPKLSISQSKAIYDEENEINQNTSGLGFVNFFVRPHLNSTKFPNARIEVLAEQAKKLDAPLYGIDDDTAIKVVDGNVEVISEGTWKKFD